MNTPALIICLAVLAQTPAPLTPQAGSPPPASPSSQPTATSARGLSGTLVLPSGTPRLRALPHQVAEAPLAVRVNDIPGSGQRIEYIGVFAGRYDLREYLVHEDGRSALDLPPLIVNVESHLAADHGEDVLGLAQTNFALSAYYSRILIGLGAAWLLVPTIAIVRRMLRPAPVAVVASITPQATLPERLCAMMDECGHGPMTLSQRAKLELLLLHYGSECLGTTPQTPRELIESLSRLRNDPRTRPVVLAVETWLHGTDADSPAARADAAAKLGEFRAEHLSVHTPAAEGNS